MARWELTIVIDRNAGVPLYLQLVRGLMEAIVQGRLAPGGRMPGTRTLARSLRLHRNTVNAAYDELAAEGWIDPHSRSGTFVSRTLPITDPAPTSWRSGGRARYPMDRPPAAWRSVPSPRGGVDLVGGRPDLSLVPVAALARAYARSVRRLPGGALGYGDPRGHERLRSGLAEMLRHTRGLAVNAGNILVTCGSQMALYLVARALLRPGDVVAVETLGYRSAWAALRSTGARLLPVRLDAEGLRVDELATLAKRVTIRAAYLTPHHQYPTTVQLSPARRIALLRLARRHRFAILEDDYDHEVHFDGRPIVPLAAADGLASVLYLGSLSKIFAPGLRLGYVVAPEEVVHGLAAHRSVIDLSGNAGIELAAAELLEDGEVQRHLRRVTRVYHARRDALVRALRRELGENLEFEVPHGGTAIWCRSARRAPIEAWVERCRGEGVLFQAGSSFTFRRSRIPAIRVGFTRASEADIARAVETMAKRWK
jgi:GntR family transcriptional regulator/MocR family aminotransferase